MKVLFGGVSPFKTYLYVRLIDKEWAFNLEECSQKDGRPYFVILTVIDNHSFIIVDAVLLGKNNESTFWWGFPLQNTFLRKIDRQRVHF